MDGSEGKKISAESLNIEAGGAAVEGGQAQGYVLSSAHTVDHDSWQQVGLLLATSFNCGMVLTFSNLMLVPLGRGWGVGCLLVVGLFTAYANFLLAEFHIINGRRFIRYRDLMGFLFGREVYYITWVLQFLTLLLGNMGVILLGGRALKEIDSEFSDSPLRLQYFIIITGVAYFIFAYAVPTMSAMRNWLATSAALTLIYIVPVIVLLVKDGSSKSNTRDYEIKGSTVGKVFNAFGAISAIIVCNTSGLLPEIQSTLKRPAKANMKKALYVQYSVGLVFYYGVSVLGYWAYGSSASEYLPKQLSGSKWLKVLINSALFLQSTISQHMFAAPLHEALDTKFLKNDKSMHSEENYKRLFVLRALLFAGNTLVTAALPFMGDFVNLFGSFTLIPLTFMFPSMIFIKVRGKAARIEKKVWHWGIIIISSLLAVATTISAVRLIANNIREYQFFANT